MKPLNNQTYDRLKFITQIFLPALGTLYFALAGIWGLPSAEQVVGTVVALTTFLGVLLRLSTTTYNTSDDRFDGAMNVVTHQDGRQQMNLHLNDHPDSMLDKSELRFKVNPVEEIVEGTRE